MPKRPHRSVELRADPEELRSLVAGLSGSWAQAMQAFVTWANSTTLRELLMIQSEFPLAGDLPAFLLVNQLAYRGAARPTDMADAIGTGRSNVSKIVRRLEGAV